LIDYEIMSVRAYHKKKKHLGFVVVIRDINWDEIYAGVGVTSEGALNKAVDSMREAQENRQKNKV